MSYVELYNNNFRNLLDWRLVEGGSGDGGVAHGAAAPHDNTMSSDPGSAFRAARADGRIEVCIKIREREGGQSKKERQRIEKAIESYERLLRTITPLSPSKASV